MKLIDNYKEVKDKHSNFFKNFSAKDRLTHKDEIVSLKKQLDEFESKIINGILNYTLDYSRVMFDLSKHELQHFLDDNVEIERFLTNQKISYSIGYNENARNQILVDFKSMCERVWEDFIITSEERNKLNQFCRDNLVDKTQQFLIEQEVSKKFTDGFDLNKIVKFYYLNENLKGEDIQTILSKEYKKKVSIDRINTITSELNDVVSVGLDIGDNKSKLIKTINYNDIITIYLIVINGNLTSGFEFEIGFNENENKSLKIMISEKTYNNSDESRLIDIITDGLCYNLCSNSMNLRNFLEQKSIIREGIEFSF